jgi:hypothetical protein
LRARDPSPQDLSRARKARTVGTVLIVTMAIWLLVQIVGGEMGLPVRFAFLFDFAAIAAFLWAMVVTWQLWRARQG